MIVLWVCLEATVHSPFCSISACLLVAFGESLHQSPTEPHQRETKIHCESEKTRRRFPKLMLPKADVQEAIGVCVCVCV